MAQAARSVLPWHASLHGVLDVSGRIQVEAKLKMTLVVEATQNATTYVHLGITTAQALGKGNGPLNHLHSIQRIQLLRK